MPEPMPQTSTSQRQDETTAPLRLRVARFSILVSLVVLGMKYAAWAISGAGALLSDAIETILNVLAAIGTLWAVAFSARPADDNHPYGHGKAEYVWAVIEGVLVVLTALVILGIAGHDALHLQAPEAPISGALLNGAAGVVNLIWALVLRRMGRMHQSQALRAAGDHVLSDVWASLALLVGVCLIPVLHWPWLDPLLSALVALNVLWTGFGMMRHSMTGLLDEAPPPELVNEVGQAITQAGRGALEAHDLRMRRVGALYFVEFHLIVPDDMRVTDAHDICDRIENAIRALLGRSSIHIHVEPEDLAKRHKPGASGVLVM